MLSKKGTSLTEEKKTAAIELMYSMSWRKLAKHLSVPKSTLSDFLRPIKNKEKATQEEQANILFIDIENAPSVVLSFPRWKANISPEAVLQEPFLLTTAWCWNGDTKNVESIALTDYNSFDEDNTNDYYIVKHLWKLLDKADIIVAHNASFDDGNINQRFAYWDLPPPSPYKVICTLKALKKHFKLPANSLNAATKYFELERKLSNEGIRLWRRCLEGEREAFEEMRTYNIGDIPTLVDLYYKVRPFMKNHPSLALYSPSENMRCNTCGGTDLYKEEGKYAYTALSKFEVFRCSSCGSVKRTRKNVRTKEQMTNTLANAI